MILFRRQPGQLAALASPLSPLTASDWPGQMFLSAECTIHLKTCLLRDRTVEPGGGARHWSIPLASTSNGILRGVLLRCDTMSNAMPARKTPAAP
eukprot:6491750-Amphidinium_carterae.1